MAPNKIRRRSAPQPASDKAARRLRALYDHLVRLYGPQQWWPATTALEVVIGAFLTQNTAWTSVERSLANLQARGILNIDGLRTVPEDELRTLIRPSGFMIRKAAALKAFVAFLDAHYAGNIDTLAHQARHNAHAVRRQLLALPGVGPETADAILLYALEAPAMVVDEYLRRITVRHGLVPEHAQYSAIQSLAEHAFAADRDHPEALAQHYNEFHALIVLTGKTHCRRTPICDGCPLVWDPHQPDRTP